MSDRDRLASIERLIAAGIIVSHTDHPVTRTGEVEFTAEFLSLLLAGRLPDREPGFIRAWLTGDPAVVRAWIEREAAALGVTPPSVSRPRRRPGAGPKGRRGPTR